MNYPRLVLAALGGLVASFAFAIANVLHNYMNLNIGLKLALGQAAAYFLQWTIIGIVISLIYKPRRMLTDSVGKL